MKFEGRGVWAEVSLGALQENLRVIQRHIGRQRKVLAIVKANAYGHGAVGVAKALARAGAHAFGVTCTAEGAELRQSGIRQPILVLSGFWPREEARLLRYRLTPALTRLEQLRYLERAAARGRRRVVFHLKVETGMNRLGLSLDQIESFARALADCPHLRLEATFTHLASAEVFTSEQSEQQLGRFQEALDRLRAARLSPGLVHIANSAAIAARPDTWADMVRPGALLYGYHQFFEPPERKAEVEEKIPLRPVLSLRARIISLRDVPSGQGIGYNARFMTQRPARIAVIAAGYADGLVRQLTNRGCALVRGRCAPLVGTISMDLSMVDVTDVPDVQVGDIATVYGSDGDASISAADVAKRLGTVSSDLLCAIGRRVPRFYVA